MSWVNSRRELEAKDPMRGTGRGIWVSHGGSLEIWGKPGWSMEEEIWGKSGHLMKNREDGWKGFGSKSWNWR
ncbi:hypothetical protein AAC387_Pa06g1659 [Persea americana]